MGYNIKVQPRKGRGGGICVMNRPNIDVQKCNIKKYSTFECLEVKVKGVDELLRMSTIYRTGNLSTEKRELFLYQLNEYCETLLLKTGKSIICGDFNIHIERKELESTEFIDAMECNGYFQIVHEPTHCNGGTLDLIFLRKDDFDIDNITSSLKIYDLSFSLGSDHSFVEFDIPLKILLAQKQLCIKYRNLKNINVGNFRGAVKLELESKAISDLDFDEAHEHLNSSLAKVIDTQAPLTSKKVTKKRDNFITSEITSLRRARRKAERKYRKSKTDEDLKIFKDLVVRVSKEVKTSRKDFYTNKLTRCKNGRETFQIVSKLLDKRTTKGILPAHHDDENLCNDFEQYFHEKIERIRTGIEEDIRNSPTSNSNFHDEKRHVDNELKEFSLLTSDDLKQILKQMSMKFCDLDPIPTWLFMSCEEEIMLFLMLIINGALDSGNFLKALKIALVKPNLKKETLDSDLFGNYRPVSNIPFL